MNLVYLSPHYPPHFGHFVERLSERGVKVLGITDQYDHQLRSELQNALTSHYRVESLNRVDQVLQGCEHFAQQFGRLDHVESHLEPWLELEATIRDRFDIPGKRVADLGFARQKSLMKATYAKAKVPCARGEMVRDFEQCVAFAGGKYPVFIKPDIGVGANDTYTIHSEDDLRRFFAVKQDYDYFLEEFLSGVIESFDGLTDRNGNIVFCTAHRFSDDIHVVVKKNKNLYYYSLREIPADLEDLGRKTVAAIDIRAKFFHLEFFRLPDGTLKALEINLRIPGGLTSHMFNYACDIDVYDWWAAVVASGESTRPYERRQHCAFVSRKYDRGYRYDHDELKHRLGRKMVHHQPMSPIEWAVMGDVGYLVRSADESELLEMIRMIIEEA